MGARAPTRVPAKGYRLTLALALALMAPLAAAHGGPAETDLRGRYPHVRADLDAALVFLEGPASRAQGALAPMLLEAAGAAKLDVTAWPPGNPIADAVPAPTPTDALMPMLRPIHARAMAGLGPFDASEMHIGTRILQSANAGQLGDPALLNDDVWALRTVTTVGADLHWQEERRLGDSIKALWRNQTGGWSWAPGGQPEVDMTGMALEALARMGALPPASARDAVAFLANHSVDGGYPLAAGGTANCNSTVWAIRGHSAAGAAVPEPAWRFLRSLRQQDGGYSFQSGGASDVLCTAEVATLLGEALWGKVSLASYPEPGEAPKPTPATSAAWIVAACAVALGPIVARRGRSLP